MNTYVVQFTAAIPCDAEVHFEASSFEDAIRQAEEFWSTGEALEISFTPMVSEMAFPKIMNVWPKGQRDRLQCIDLDLPDCGYSE